ncbi:MAG: LptA/OstA family protein, partial [Candidatus Margulisiibacteriota bacterium]
DNGKKVWEFFAKHGWAGKDNEITYLENVTGGKFFKDGDLIVKNLKAPRVKAWRQSKIVEAYGLPENVTTGESRLLATIAFTPKGKRKYAALTADTIIYNPDNKTSNVSGRIRLKNQGSTLFAEQMLIDHDKEISNLIGSLEVLRKDIALSCGLMDYFAKDERMVCRDKVRSKISGKPNKTAVNCEYMELFADENKDMYALGSLEVIQGKKTAWSDHLTYNKANRRIILTGKVKTVIEKARALLKAQTIKKLDSEEQKKLLREKTLLDSDTLKLSTKNGDAKASGNVLVTQKGRQAKADSAEYSEKTESITLIGNVYLKKENQWIRCQKINISVKDEIFDAIGSVEAEFKLKK